MPACPKTWAERNGLTYALLRLKVDTRPTWARSIELHSYALNGQETPVPPPRLRYKRKIGSHPVNPKAEPRYVSAEEERYDSFLREMKLTVG